MKNIINLLSGQFSCLLSKITSNIKEEITKINNAYIVFSTIARGTFHYSDILSKSWISTTSTLYDTLEVLEKMDLITYVVEACKTKEEVMDRIKQIKENLDMF